MGGQEGRYSVSCLILFWRVAWKAGSRDEGSRCIASTGARPRCEGVEK